MNAARVIALAFVSLIASASAYADIFTFNYTGTGVSASGLLTGDLTSTAGVYQIASITGSRNGVAITGLDPNDPFADQLLYFPGVDTGTALWPTFLDNDGLAFFAGSTSFNIFTSDVRPTVVENDFGPAVQLTVNRSVAVTPEPSSFALFGTGLLGVVGIARRRLTCS